MKQTRYGFLPERKRRKPDTVLPEIAKEYKYGMEKCYKVFKRLNKAVKKLTNRLYSCKLLTIEPADATMYTHQSFRSGDLFFWLLLSKAQADRVEISKNFEFSNYDRAYNHASHARKRVFAGDSQGRRGCKRQQGRERESRHDYRAGNITKSSSHFRICRGVRARLFRERPDSGGDSQMRINLQAIRLPRSSGPGRSEQRRHRHHAD